MVKLPLISQRKKLKIEMIPTFTPILSRKEGTGLRKCMNS